MVDPRQEHCNDPGNAPPIMLDAPAAARALGIGQTLLAELTKAGKVPHARLGRRLLYPRELLERCAVAWAQEGNGSA